jgi:hypothetical protein
MENLIKTGFAIAAVLAVLFTTSCKNNQRSSTTGWKYNDQKWGGFEKKLDFH